MNKKRYAGILFSFVLAAIICYINPKYVLIVLTILAGLVIVTFYNTLLEIETLNKREIAKLTKIITVDEYEIKEKKAELKSVMNSINVGIIYINNYGEIRYLNDFIRTEFNIEQIKSIKYLNTNNIANFIKRAFIIQKDNSREIQFDEKFYHLESKNIYEDGTHKGLIIVAYDITKTKDASEKQKTFIQDISHELKTPLTSIRGIAEILNRDNKSELTSILQEESNRMENIVKELLEYSKLERNEDLLVLETIDSNQLVDDLIKTIKGLNTNIKINKNIECTSFKGDYHLLLRAIGNLLKNALKHARNSIDINVINFNDNVLISVVDDGAGIEKKHFNKLFDRFYRIDQSRTKSDGGTGLGLAIAKSITKKHGGSIYVESELEQYSRFVISIPKRAE